MRSAKTYDCHPIKESTQREVVAVSTSESNHTSFGLLREGFEKHSFFALRRVY